MGADGTDGASDGDPLVAANIFEHDDVASLTWIAKRTFAWLGGNRRSSKDCELNVHTSETMLDVVAIRLMLNRLAPT